MSLLNDMLRDLNSRGRVPLDESRDALSGLVAAPLDGRSRSPGMAWALPLALGTALAAAAGLGVIRGATFETAEQATRIEETGSPTPKQPAILPPPGDVAAAPAGPATWARTEGAVELDDIQIETKGSHTRMRLALSESTDYWIEGGEPGDEVEVVLSNTRLSAAMPPLDLFGTSIAAVEAKESLLGLHILLHLDRSSRVRSQMLRGRRNDELILDLMPLPESPRTEREAPAQARFAAPAPEPPVSRPPALSEPSEYYEPTAAALPPPSPAAAAAFAGPVPPSTASSATQPPAAGPPARVEITRARSRVSPAESAYRRARELASQGLLKAALADFERALELDPRHLAARESLVTLLIQRGGLEDAATRVGRGLSQSPDHVPFLVLQARVLDASGHAERAIALLEESLAPASRPAAYDELLGSLLQRSGRGAAAAAAYRRALRRDSENGRLWLGLGLALDTEGRGDEALRVYHTAQMTRGVQSGPQRWLEQRIRELEATQR